MYNAENVICNALDSVKNQTFPLEKFEIIVVNDGSTDNSFEVVKSYIEKNPALNIQLINQENGGVSNARNAALKVAEGDYIALLDSDDEWYPPKIERQMSVLEDENLKVDFLGSRRKNHEILYPYKVEANHLAKITFGKLMFRNETQPSTVIFKNNVLQNTGLFDGTQRYAEDLNYWLKVTKHSEMYILDEELVLAGGGKRTFGISGLSANLKEMEQGFQKNLKEMLILKRINSLQYLGYYIFYKIKYVIRISRNKILKLKGL